MITKYKFPKLLQHFLLSLSLLVSFISITPAISQPVYAADCATPNKSCDCKGTDLTKENCGIIYWILIVINVLSGLVGLVVVTSIIVAGIQYSSSGNDPQKMASARDRIVNSLIALAVFVFMYAFLQWVIPGGVL